MATKHYLQKNSESGFALLMSMVVMGVLISIGLSVLELSLKQVELSTNVRDSEIAFHAANAGMECSRYWRRAASSTMEAGGAFNPTCFDTISNPVSVVAQPITGTDVSGDGNIYKYDYNFTWGGTNAERCSQISALVFNAATSTPSLDLDNIQNYISGYPSTVTTFDCEGGARCTVMSVQGYNKNCGAITDFGTLQREVLLEF